MLGKVPGVGVVDLQVGVLVGQAGKGVAELVHADIAGLWRKRHGGDVATGAGVVGRVPDHHHLGVVRHQLGSHGQGQAGVGAQQAHDAWQPSRCPRGGGTGDGCLYGDAAGTGIDLADMDVPGAQVGSNLGQEANFTSSS